MRAPASVRPVVVLAALAALLAGGASCKGSSGAKARAEDRGRSIYVRGVSLSGKPISVELGAGSPVASSMFPCANCHGLDGRGKPEGGLTPSDVRWDALTRPYTITEASGRRHAPYDAQRFGRAVTMGLDPSDNRLDSAMPRYGLSAGELEDVIAYLKELGNEPDPGLTDAEIRIGAVLPDEASSSAGDARDMEAALRAFFDEINKNGGVYGRRIALRSARAPAAPLAREEALRAFLEAERPFALVSLVLDASDDGLAALVGRRRVPVIGALSLYPRISPPQNRYVFYLHAGVAEQGRALASFAAAERAGGGVAIIHAGEPGQVEAARRIAEKCRRLGLGEAMIVNTSGRAEDLGLAVDRRPGIVFLLGGARDAWERLLGSGSHPLVLVPAAPSAGARMAALGSVKGRVFASFPSLASDRTAQAMAEYRALAASHHLAGAHLDAELSVLAGGKILVEGLRRSGRALSREGLVSKLETLQSFETGFTPPITYGANRRIGALGAYVVAAGAEGDDRRRPAGWIPDDE